MDILSKAKALEFEGKVTHFEVGESDFDTAEPIVTAGVKALKRVKRNILPPRASSSAKSNIPVLHTLASISQSQELLPVARVQG